MNRIIWPCLWLKDSILLIQKASCHLFCCCFQIYNVFVWCPEKQTNKQKCFISTDTFWMIPSLCKPMSELLQVFLLTLGLKQHLEFHCSYCQGDLQSNQLDRAEWNVSAYSYRTINARNICMAFVPTLGFFSVSWLLSMHLFELNHYSWITNSRVNFEGTIPKKAN